MAGAQSTPPQPAVQGETPSPLCNYLLEQVKLRLEDGISAADLKASTGEALKSLEQARGQTIGNLERDGAKDEVLEAFEKSFEDMQSALEEIERFAGNATEETHESVRQVILRAALATTRAVTVMQQSQFSEGPTDMPLFNGLFQMKERYLQGGVEGRQVREALVNIVKMTKAAIEELLAGDGEQPPQRDGLVRAYEEQIESLERVGETIDTGSKDKAAIDEAFDELLRTSNAVREAMASLNEAMMSQGPCRLARTNVLLSASETFRNGNISAEQFSRTIDSYEGEIKAEQAAVNELAGMADSTQAISAEIQGIRDAYDMHDEALAIFSEFLDGDAEPEDFAKAQKMLIEASEKLSDHKEEMDRLGESEGKVSCVRCGGLNEPGGRVCGKCGAQLPQQAGISGISSTMSFQEGEGGALTDEGDLVVTANLEKLFNAVNEMAEGRSSDADFEGVLDWLDGLLESAIGTMPELPALAFPDLTDEQATQIGELKVGLAEQRDNILEGMNDVRDALNTLSGYLEDRQKDTLIAGVRAVRDGAVKMQQGERALKITQEALEKAAEAARQREDEDGIESPEAGDDGDADE